MRQTPPARSQSCDQCCPVDHGRLVPSVSSLFAPVVRADPTSRFPGGIYRAGTPVYRLHSRFGKRRVIGQITSQSGSVGALFLRKRLTNLALREISKPWYESKVITGLQKSAGGFASVSVRAFGNVWANHGARATHWARQLGASNGSAKYCVSCDTFPSRNSMTLTVKTRLPL